MTIRTDDHKWRPYQTNRPHGVDREACCYKGRCHQPAEDHPLGKAESIYRKKEKP